MPAPTVPSSAPTPMPPQSGVPQFDPNKLADIHLPDAITFWPIAPGWWLSIALIILAVWLIIYLKKRPPKQKPRTAKQLKSQAYRELEAIKKVYKTSGVPHEAVKQLSIFLRRYALSLHQRNSVASLTDEQWLKVLDTMFDKQTESTLFSQKFSDLLTAVPYQSADKPVDTELLTQLFESSKQLIESNDSVPVQEPSSGESAHV